MARVKLTYPEGHPFAGDDCWVETGRGIVETMKWKPGDRNAHVQINATHTEAVKIPVGGYVDALNDQQMGACRRSEAEGMEVVYRVEVQRKRNVSRDLLYDDLTKEQKVRNMVEVELLADYNARQAQAAQKPAESQPPRQAPATAPAATQPPQERAPVQAPAQQRAPQQERPQPAQPAQPAPTPKRAGGRQEEARPWQELNSDGTPNLGSYAVTAGAGISGMAVDLVLAAPRRPFPSLVRFVAERLMDAADEIQAGVRSDGHYDRMDNSHTRARGILHNVLRMVPFPLDALTDTGHPEQERITELHEWHARTVRAGIELMKLAVDLSGIEYRADPREHDDADRGAEQAERERRALIIAEWPSVDEFNAAHTTYGKLMTDGLAEEVKLRIKGFKDEQQIGWPLNPAEYQLLIEKVQECVREAAACEHCRENPCVCAAARQPVPAGGPLVCSDCDGAGCEYCAPF